jgi:hypothetical protein
MDKDIEISAPAFDTVRQLLVLPVSPWHQKYVPSSVPILQRKSEASSELVGRYICLQCNTAVLPKRGNSGLKRWHFAHYPVTPCSQSKETIKGKESADHLMSKMLIFNFLKRGGIFTVRCKCSCNNLVSSHEIKLEKSQDISIEYRLKDGNRADICIHDKKGDEVYIIEICYSHKTTSIRKEPWFEFMTDSILERGEEFKTIDHIQLTDIKEHVCGKCQELHRQENETKILLASIAEAKCEEDRLRKVEEDRLRKVEQDRLRKVKEDRLRKVEEDRLRKVEEDRLRKVEQDRLRKVKEDRLRKVEEDRLRKVEEDRLRKVEEDRLRKVEKDNEDRLRKSRAGKLEEARLRKNVYRFN